MASLNYVDAVPTVSQRNGMVTIDLQSGDETISLIVTRHAADALRRKIATQMLFLDDEATQDQTVIPFPKPSRRRKGKA